jgi:hypothetical protein
LIKAASRIKTIVNAMVRCYFVYASISGNAVFIIFVGVARKMAFDTPCLEKANTNNILPFSSAWSGW